jgi:tetratricopeptide (TPR) repeat protein
MYEMRLAAVRALFSSTMVVVCAAAAASPATERQAPAALQQARDRIVEMYRKSGAAGAIAEARKLAEGPLGRPEDCALVGGLYAENGDEATAEAWYRKAVDGAPDDPFLRTLLGGSLLWQSKFRDAVKEIEAAMRLPGFSSEHGAVYARLGDAYEGAGDPQAALCARGAALLEDPHQSEFWLPLEAAKKSMPEKASGNCPLCLLGDWSLFQRVIDRGSPGRWSAQDLDDAVALYIQYADSLSAAIKPDAAQRFRRLAARAAVWNALHVIRQGDVPRTLQLFALAEQAAPLSELDEDYQVAALRDMMVAYGRSGKLSHAAAAFGRLMDVCHHIEQRGEECPVEAVVVPMFAGRVQSGIKIPPGEQVNIMHLGLLMQRILASVSFDPATGRPYYTDGHDFVGPRVSVGGKPSHRTKKQNEPRYGSVSADEDRVTLQTEDEKTYRERAIADMKKGRFELVVKKWLSGLCFLLGFGIPLGPEFADSEVLGIWFKDVRSAIDAAPPGSVPEPTVQAVRLAVRTLENLRLLPTHN